MQQVDNRQHRKTNNKQKGQERQKHAAAGAEGYDHSSKAYKVKGNNSKEEAIIWILQMNVAYASIDVFRG